MAKFQYLYLTNMPTIRYASRSPQTCKEKVNALLRSSSLEVIRTLVFCYLPRSRRRAPGSRGEL
jgi:hypothetical protein